MTQTMSCRLMSGVDAAELNLPPQVSVTPTGSTTGVRVHGIDLADDLPGEVIGALVRLFDHAGLVILPGQDRLTPERQQEISQWFGRPYARGRVGFGTGSDAIASVNDSYVQILGNIDASERGSSLKVMQRDADGAAYSIHSDVQDYPIPPDVTILHGVQVPPPEGGGNTYFYDLYAAFDELDEATKQRASRLKWRARTLRELGAFLHEHKVIDDPGGPSTVLHPVVRTHPVTGRKALWISPDMTKEIVGLDGAEAADVLTTLLAHVTDDKFSYCHVWTRHDVLMWDNRCVNHRRDAYDTKYIREMHRSQAGGSLTF